MPRPADCRSRTRSRNRRSRGAWQRRFLSLDREASARHWRFRHRDLSIHAAVGPQGDLRFANARLRLLYLDRAGLETTMKQLKLPIELFGAMLLAANPALAQQKKVAIANMGPHGSLEQVIAGFKQALADKGFVEGKEVVYEYSDTNFNPNLIPQV